MGTGPDDADAGEGVHHTVGAAFHNRVFEGLQIQFADGLLVGVLFLTANMLLGC
jgi:hypothetical protein